MARPPLVAFELLGAKELNEFFTGVSARMRTTIIKESVKFAADIVRSPLYQATPVARYTSPSAKFPIGTTQAATGVIVRAKKGAVSAYIGHFKPAGSAAGWTERGTKPRFLKTGQSTGAVTPKPFFQPLWNTLRGTVMSALRDQIAIRLAAYNKRADKKFAKTMDL